MAWAKIPSWWVHEERLKSFSWRLVRSNGTAALMVLIALSIRMNQSNINRSPELERLVEAEVTYDQLQILTVLSRAKIAAGLQLLEELGIIEVSRDQRSNRYRLPGIGEPGKWAQLPQTHLIAVGSLRGFSTFQLRHRNELNALKLYVLFLAFRNSRGNFAAIGYEKIGEITGLMRSDIPQAASLLVNHDLIHVIQSEPDGGLGKPYNRYTIQGLGRSSRN